MTGLLLNKLLKKVFTNRSNQKSALIHINLCNP